MIDSTRAQVWGAVVNVLLYGYASWLFSGSEGAYAARGAWLKWSASVGLVACIVMAIAKSLRELLTQGRETSGREGSE